MERIDPTDIHLIQQQTGADEATAYRLYLQAGRRCEDAIVLYFDPTHSAREAQQKLDRELKESATEQKFKRIRTIAREVDKALDESIHGCETSMSNTSNVAMLTPSQQTMWCELKTVFRPTRTPDSRLFENKAEVFQSYSAALRALHIAILTANNHITRTLERLERVLPWHQYLPINGNTFYCFLATGEQFWVNHTNGITQVVPCKPDTQVASQWHWHVIHESYAETFHKICPDVPAFPIRLNCFFQDVRRYNDAELVRIYQELLASDRYTLWNYLEQTDNLSDATRNPDVSEIRAIFEREYTTQLTKVREQMDTLARSVEERLDKVEKNAELFQNATPQDNIVLLPQP